MKISTYIVSIILTTLLLFNSVSVSLNYAYYNIDPVGFIEAFCENQDKPELQCNGKCHLKKVSQTQEKEQKSPENIIDFKELTLYPNLIVEFDFLYESITKSNTPKFYKNLYTYSNSNDCFHPPRV